MLNAWLHVRVINFRIIIIIIIIIIICQNNADVMLQKDARIICNNATAQKP